MLTEEQAEEVLQTVEAFADAVLQRELAEIALLDGMSRPGRRAVEKIRRDADDKAATLRMDLWTMLTREEPQVYGGDGG